jgi:hypothetical protein
LHHARASGAVIPGTPDGRLYGDAGGVRKAKETIHRIARLSARTGRVEGSGIAVVVLIEVTTVSPSGALVPPKVNPTIRSGGSFNNMNSWMLGARNSVSPGVKRRSDDPSKVRRNRLSWASSGRVTLAKVASSEVVPENRTGG